MRLTVELCACRDESLQEQEDAKENSRIRSELDRTLQSRVLSGER